jgi:hypothetical protein
LDPPPPDEEGVEVAGDEEVEEDEPSFDDAGDEPSFDDADDVEEDEALSDAVALLRLSVR